uniref:Uncharacterized protein n=1 Tax=Anguilla anguilla TaxID=7936 RepID=A0A0E9UEV4_ANGAN
MLWLRPFPQFLLKQTAQQCAIIQHVETRVYTACARLCVSS